jgi:hypothetical protein
MRLIFNCNSNLCLRQVVKIPGNFTEGQTGIITGVAAIFYSPHHRKSYKWFPAFPGAQ